jgi:hypothetical protein
VVDRGGLENRCASCRYRGFESHPLRHSGIELGTTPILISSGADAADRSAVSLPRTSIVFSPTVMRSTSSRT